MSFAILGLGTAVPDSVVSQADALIAARRMGGDALRDSPWLANVYAHSGIDTRHQAIGQAAVRDLVQGTHDSGSPFVRNGDAWRAPGTATRMQMYAESAPPLAVTAARVALAEADVSPASITHLVTVSCTGFVAPGVDVAVIRGLNLGATVLRTHVGFMGCHGAINGLRVAQAFADADPRAVVLLVAVELCSLHYHFGTEPETCVANALFADGAAAVVGRASESPWRATASGSCLIPDSDAAMSWSVGDEGFAMTLSRQIPRLIGKHLRPWLTAWLAERGHTLASVGSWAIHPGGPRILDAVEESLEIGRASASREVFAAYGNMSSPTVLFIVDRLRRRDAPRPCVALGFGPGLVAEAVLFE